MEKWQTRLRLKFKRIPFKIKVGFDYEWKAWLIAYDHLKISPEEFAQMDLDRQLTVLAFGAASWHRIKQGKNVPFSYDDLIAALLRASKAENQRLTETMSYAKFPDWMKQDPGQDKKKSET